MAPPSFETRLAVVEERLRTISEDVHEIRDTNRWILRVLGAAFITGTVFTLIAQLVR